MKRHELTELHYITPIANVSSILERGLLSHNLARKLPHKSIAMEEIQNRRKPKVVPRGLPLHDYVNLYINGRNKMMFKLKDKHAEICVLRLDPGVLDIEGTVISDRNASSDYARFYASPHGLEHIDKDKVFAKYWTHDDPIDTMRHSSVVCAEVLVPHSIEPAFILGAYVSCKEAMGMLTNMNTGINIELNAYMFFTY